MIDTDQPKDLSTRVSLTELQDAGLISPDGGSFTSTPHPPWKKQKTSHKQSPYPHSTHTNNQHTPKRRVAHTPKHLPQAYQQNTHYSVKQNSQTPGNCGRGTPRSKFTPRQQSQKEAKKKKCEGRVLDEDADFPRGGKKGPHATGFFSSPQKANMKLRKAFGVEKNDKKKTTKKKERKLKKRQQKAAKDSSMYPSDENLFQIKQRKFRKRS